MKKKNMIIILLLIITALLLSGASYADENKQLRGKHLENEIACVDCHGTENPKKMAKTSACKSCHDSGPDVIINDTVDGIEYNLPVHKAHTGPLRCSLCHKVHEASELYCNKCHRFNIKVP
jgi:fumarate reductase flavoprotein subunit